MTALNSWPVSQRIWSNSCTPMSAKIPPLLPRNSADGGASVPLVAVHREDVAEVAAEYLLPQAGQARARTGASRRPAARARPLAASSAQALAASTVSPHGFSHSTGMPAAMTSAMHLDVPVGRHGDQRSVDLARRDQFRQAGEDRHAGARNHRRAAGSGSATPATVTWPTRRSRPDGCAPSGRLRSARSGTGRRHGRQLLAGRLHVVSSRGVRGPQAGPAGHFSSARSAPSAIRPSAVQRSQARRCSPASTSACSLDPAEPDRDHPVGQLGLGCVLVDQRAALLVGERHRVEHPDDPAPQVLLGSGDPHRPAAEVPRPSRLGRGRGDGQPRRRRPATSS